MAAMGGMQGVAAAAGTMLPPPPTAFDPADVFGPDMTASAGGGGEMPAEGGDAGGMMGMAMGAAPALRWVGTTEGQPFRERGFYLSIIVNQQRIPDFLVNLCESAWPTKVYRFQMGPNPYRKEVTGGAGGMAYDPYGAGMFAGGSGGENYMSSNINTSMISSMMGSGMMGGMSSQAKYPGGPPTFAMSGPKDPFNGSLNQPDLVQLDVAGIITFYVSSEAAAEAGAPAVDTPSAPGGDATLLTTPAAATPADGTTPPPAATPPATAPAGDAAPATPPAATPPATETPAPAAPAATTPPAETPAATAPPAATPPAEPAAPPPN